ncbi:DNA-binding protein [uncultured Acetobacteroides sp.]|uniref:DNA-binding protein n=1 Tax=uncultured Acetobacteroides sp. TaxID=1760811 RepID=UPI0029F59608|nr:DNA-binding protein [uncultured Acetobacteroides sp.]
MKNETKVIYFDEGEYKKRISLHEKLIPGVEASLRELRSLGIEPSIEKLLKLLGGGSQELVQEWRASQPEPKDSFLKFQQDQYVSSLDSKLGKIVATLRNIPRVHLKWQAEYLVPLFSISNYEIANDGKVVLAESFLEEQRAELSIYADTPEKTKVLDLSEKACKALNELQAYLKKLSDEGAFSYNAVSLETVHNIPLIPYNYDSNYYYVDYSSFGDVGVKPRSR